MCARSSVAGAVQVQAVYEQAAKKAELAKKHFVWLARTHVQDEMEENEEDGFEALRCVHAFVDLQRTVFSDNVDWRCSVLLIARIRF